jgi:hypothetical protein
MKTEIKNVKHLYTGPEREQLGMDLARAFGTLRGVEVEFDQVKQSYKSKTAEAEARIDRLSTNINNGFDLRDASCVVVYRPADKEKDFFLETEAQPFIEDNYLPEDWDGISPVLTERMTTDDFQQELIEAESKFDCREEIELFKPTESDRGILVVGRLAERWFSALRVKIGKLELTERLDAEQKCAAAVLVAVKRFNTWAKKNLKELAAGFAESASGVIEAHKERAE